MNKVTLEKKAEAARKKAGLTVEEMQGLQSAAYGLYSGELGGDMPADRKDGTCSRAVIIEVVLDAGRLEQEIFGSRGLFKNPQYKNIATDAVRDVFKNNFKNNLLEDLVGPAFTFDRYEVGQPYDASYME